MGRTVPISAGQPPDTTRTAAGQVVRAAAAQAVAMQAASLALAALLRPLTPAATRTCSRSPRPPAAELPGPHLPQPGSLPAPRKPGCTGRRGG